MDMFLDFPPDISVKFSMFGAIVGVAVFVIGVFILKHFIFYGLDQISKEEDWKKSIGRGLNHLILAGSVTLIFQGFSTISMIFKVWVGACFIWIFYGLMDPLCFLIRKYLVKAKEKEFHYLFSFIERLFKGFILIIGCLLIAQNVGLDISSLLAGLGIGGIAIALAAKDSLSNFFGSLVIAFDRPFVPGDYICFEQIEGVVESIGIRSTQIKTFYDSTVSIPNSILAQTKIDNLGKRKYRRSRFTLGVTYSTPPEKIKSFIQGIKQLIQNHPQSKKDAFQVSFSGYSSSSLDIFINVFFDVSEWSQELQCRQELYLDILKLAHKEGIEFAFPTQSLYIEKMNSQTTT